MFVTPTRENASPYSLNQGQVSENVVKPNVFFIIL